MRVLFIPLLWLLTAGRVLAGDPPSIKVSSYAGGVAEIIVYNPTASSIHFEAPPGQNPASVEVLEADKWVPLSHPWCGTGYDFVEIPAGSSKTYQVTLDPWMLRGKTFRFHVWYLSDTDYKKFMKDHSPESLRTLHFDCFHADPTDA